MNITFTNKAIEKVRGKHQADSPFFLKLKYDTDGCGCVVSGVTSLWIVDEKESDDIAIETNIGSVYVERTKQVFMDENMTVDYNESAHSFMLKCPSQILNPRMAFIDKTKEPR
ncbi:iron-sulfur cluster biosynthesis family protein [Priestia megaterium]|nr:iron-sulfur cluster biosynthesis family protein [Priestia megaterium]